MDKPSIDKLKPEGKRRFWDEYQKEIPDDKYYYVRSCIRQNFLPAAEQTFLRVLNDLGKNVYESPHHTTCSGIGYHCDVVPPDTAMTVIARQFALMAEAGYENYAVSCITSFGLYTEILNTWQHFPELKEKTGEFLKQATGRKIATPKHLAHACDIIFKLRDEIAQKAKHKLVNKQTGKPLRVVDHIGCHYAKMFPRMGVGGAEYPYVLAGMVESWGGEVVDYPERRHCCGFGFRQYLVKANRGYSIANTKKKFDSMEPFKPDMIITNCPGCNYFLDRWQYAIAEMEGKTYGEEKGQGIPILTYEEVAGLVMGYNPWDIGLQVHQIAVEPLLDKIGIVYNAEDKYKGVNGKDLGQPEKPTNIKSC